MSGHSKWKTNKGKKSIADAKKGASYTKLIKEITVIARDGGGNPDTNSRLRAVMQKAKEASMPSDNIKMIGTNFMWCSILLNRNERPMVAMNETTVIIRSCKAKVPNECVSIVSLNARKLKMRTPRMSDRLLS